MGVIFKYLDENKQQMGYSYNEICFYRANYIEGMRYFSYRLNTTYKQKEWIEFINNLKLFPKISMRSRWFHADITKFNSLELFAVLTLLRYIDEEQKIIDFCILNKDNTTYTPLQILLLGHTYTINIGHTISKKPVTLEHILNYKYEDLYGLPIVYPTLLTKRLHATFNIYGKDWYSDFILPPEVTPLENN